MKFILALFIFTSIASAQSNQAVINDLLDKWHKDASAADEASYFNFISEDGIFMGTDATERWTKKEFQQWAAPYFKKESAWTLTPISRTIYFSHDNNFAWFDEEFESSMGPCRGSGVLQFAEGEWKIVHYNLALTIPNEIIPQVRELVKESLKEK
jgi:hypothetical protein